MTEQEVRRYLRQMKEEDSERAFHSFYNLCYDRLFRIACYFVKYEEWAQEIVLDVFMKLWEQRARLPEVNNIEDYCFILTKNASLNYLEKRTDTLHSRPNSFPNFPARPILPKTLLSAKNCLPDMSRRSTACRSVAVKYSSACAKRNKAMHKWRRS